MIEERIQSAKLLVAYFSHDDCQVCKVLKPRVQQLTLSLANVEFLYVDIRAYPAVSGQHLVFAVPTVIIFAYGREQRRFSRHFSVDEIAAELQRITSS